MKSDSCRNLRGSALPAKNAVRGSGQFTYTTTGGTMTLSFQWSRRDSAIPARIDGLPVISSAVWLMSGVAKKNSMIHEEAELRIYIEEYLRRSAPVRWVNWILKCPNRDARRRLESVLFEN